MAVQGGLLRMETRGNGDVIDITEGVLRVIRTAAVERGIVTIFATGSTAAVTTMEYEHNRLNHDTNSHAHLRAAIIGPSESVPIVDGRLALGTWQQLVLIDFDDRPRSRSVSVQVLS